jgi:phosphatidylserine synthase
VGANCILHVRFYPQVAGAATAALTITDNASGSPQSISLTGTATTSAAVSLSTVSIAFGNQTVNTESAAQIVTLTNTGAGKLSISGVALTGTNKAQFLISANYCPASLAAGANCVLHVRFYPQVAGAATAALTITDSASGSPQPVSLTGTATTPGAVFLSTASIAFGNQTVNTESAAQVVTLTNTGAGKLSISGVALTGMNKAQFLVSANYCPASLVGGANCILHVRFYPQVAGAATAALTITDSASGSPQSVSLTGTATTPGAVSLSTSSIAFGNQTVNTESAAQVVTLTNTGGSVLSTSGVALTGTNNAQFLISANYCPASLAAGANCVLHVRFYPKAAGAATAALTITDNASGSPQSVSLTGTGINPAPPTIASVSQNSAMAGGAALLLTVNGAKYLRRLQL